MQNLFVLRGLIANFVLNGLKLSVGGLGMTFCDKRGNGGWTNPRLRIQQAVGFRTKALSRELEQRECTDLPNPPIDCFSFIATNFALN
jgi:hypothetical protein